jgi:hypothetical protein
MDQAVDRIYQYHVRKTAGTSLDSSFWALGGAEVEEASRREETEAVKPGEPHLRFVRHDPELIARGDYFYASSHLPMYAVTVPPGTFTVTILRDPAARVISYYRYLLWVRRHGPEAAKVEPFWEQVRAESAFMDGGFHYLRSQIGSSGVTMSSVAGSVRQFGLRRMLKRLVPAKGEEGGDGGGGGAEDFPNFLRRIPPRRLLSQLHMFSAAMDPVEAAENALSCSAVLFTETFSEDLGRLARRLELPLEEKRERRFSMEVELSESDRERLRDQLQPEYEMLERVKVAAPAARSAS